MDGKVAPGCEHSKHSVMSIKVGAILNSAIPKKMRLYLFIAERSCGPTGWCTTSTGQMAAACGFASKKSALHARGQLEEDGAIETLKPEHRNGITACRPVLTYCESERAAWSAAINRELVVPENLFEAPKVMDQRWYHHLRAVMLSEKAIEGLIRMGLRGPDGSMLKAHAQQFLDLVNTVVAYEDSSEYELLDVAIRLTDSTKKVGSPLGYIRGIVNHPGDYRSKLSRIVASSRRETVRRMIPLATIVDGTRLPEPDGSDREEGKATVFVLREKRAYPS